MSAKPRADLEQVKRAFENFRAGRKGKERIPENLWAAAVALLDHYSFNQVRQELRLKPEYLKRRLATDQLTPAIKQPLKFLKLNAGEIAAAGTTAQSSTKQISECRLVIERVDGSRLTLSCEWSRIEALYHSFVRG